DGWSEAIPIDLPGTRRSASAFSIARAIVAAPAPIHWIHSTLDKFCERRIRPIRRARCVAVLDRIEVNVIAVGREIPLIANRMFPVTPLPDAAFAFGYAARRTVLPAGDPLRKFRFDQAPAQREVRISRRQRPDAVQVFRENDNRVDRKRMLSRDRAKRGSEEFDLLREQR